ncbi:MAG TPA: hypothetical protein VEL76_03120 [Gemmataceae bacterium]|nr:hypothetical protein [Gemmataceae bacterium]
MQILNPEKASQFMDTVQGERQRSAVLAIHLAWLDHSSSLSCGERIEPKAPLDLPILYQATAATFEEQPAPLPAEELPPGGRVMNRQQAAERLSSLPDAGTRLLATAFAYQVIGLSTAAGSEQDLDYYLQLFLKCITDTRVIGNIVSGAIARHSDQLSDPDLW